METVFRKKEAELTIYWGKPTGVKNIENKEKRLKRQLKANPRRTNERDAKFRETRVSLSPDW